MVFSCIKLKLLQFIRTYQSSVVNNVNTHNNHRFPNNSLVRRLINLDHIDAVVVAASNSMFAPMSTTVKSTTIITLSKPHGFALSIMAKFQVPCVAMLTMCMFFRAERVPFSYRRHLVFRSLPKRFSIYRSRFITDIMVKGITKRLEGNEILPSTHEKTLRVVSIARKLGQGMHDTLGLKKEFNIVAYEPGNESNPVWTVGQRSGHSLRRSLCDTFNGSKMWFWRRYSTKHLEGAEWRVTVIDSPEFNAYLFPGKHIFVLTKMIDNCSDEELACFIGHEMGHGVGSHVSDFIMVGLLSYLFEVALNKILSPGNNQHLSIRREKIKVHENIKYYFRRKLESEADHIGMMLMASAGYDPRVAPRKLLETQGECLQNTHPSGSERMEYLNNPERMKKAMCLFREYQLRSNSLTHS